jgi:hypothetical protein
MWNGRPEEWEPMIPLAAIYLAVAAGRGSDRTAICASICMELHSGWVG